MRDRPEDGFIRTYKLDERGFVASARVIDERGRPSDFKGVHETRYVRDADGHELEVSYFDRNGAPAVNETGVHLARHRPGRLGCGEQWANFDTALRPFGGAMGVSRGVRTCDGYGNPLSMRWYSPSGAPQLNRQGIHGWDNVLDGHGARSAMINVGLDGRPAGARGLAAIVLTQRDTKGYVFGESYLDSARQPLVLGEGYAAYRYRLLENGAMAECTYLDVHGDPVMSREKHARWTRQYDSEGRHVATQYFDTSGRPASGPSGEAAATYTYDAHSLLSGEIFQGPDGRPVLGKSGFAEVRYTRDDEGRIVSRAHFGADGAAVEVASARVMWFSYMGADILHPSVIEREEAHRRAGEALRRLTSREPWQPVARQLSDSTGDQPTYGGQSYWYAPLWQSITHASPGDPPVLLDTPRGYVIVERKD